MISGCSTLQEQPPNKALKRCRCRASGKVRYRSWLEAIGALAEMPDREGHAFRCPKCGVWHISTRPQRDRYKGVRYKGKKGRKR